ncbi:MAG: helix-turn-helix domain-containing protein [Christensenellaceae bacterium]
MISEKIISLRKKSGWSQEELADRLSVSRQAVSKWESGQSVPEVEKVIALSDLFHVSTDYLLRDEETGGVPSEQKRTPAEAEAAVDEQKWTAAETEAYLKRRDRSTRLYAVATTLCILSPVLLIVLSGAVESGQIPETLAVAIGMTALLLFVTVAVALFICGGMNAQKPPMKVSGEGMAFLRRRLEECRLGYTRGIVIGIALCILSVVPLFAALPSENEFYLVCAVGALLSTVSIGAGVIVRFGDRQGVMEKLLKLSEGTPVEEDRTGKLVASSYWLIATAIYLLWSFLSGKWDTTWLVWPIAGVLFPVLTGILSLRKKK